MQRIPSNPHMYIYIIHLYTVSYKFFCFCDGFETCLFGQLWNIGEWHWNSYRPVLKGLRNTKGAPIPKGVLDGGAAASKRFRRTQSSQRWREKQRSEQLTTLDEMIAILDHLNFPWDIYIIYIYIYISLESLEQHQKRMIKIMSCSDWTMGRSSCFHDEISSKASPSIPP